MANREPPFDQATLEALCKALADTNNGLTGPEIELTLRTCQILDIDPSNTKWKRLSNALGEHQNIKKSGNHVIGFIHYAMKPVRWSDRREKFEWIRDEVNKVLAFCGLSLCEDGGVRRTQTVSTLTEAEKRATSLRAKLQTRGVHNDVLLFCRAELLDKNYFHAVLEAAKSVASKVRTLSGLTSDGAELATQAFSLGATGIPILAINSLSTDTEKGEQRGFMNLLIGLFGTFRNPTAHAPKIYWPISEQDALDIFSLVSLMHRKIDTAIKLRQP
jgi:uncharacterized protein (TIGR02391 family)